MWVFSEDVFNLVASYVPLEMVPFISKYELSLNWKRLYKILFDEYDIPILYTLPYRPQTNYTNKWEYAIYNRIKLYDTNIECGRYNTFILKDGHFMGHGFNGNCQMGNGNTSKGILDTSGGQISNNIEECIVVDSVDLGIQNVVQIKCASNSSMLVLGNGTLMGCGIDYGQLGLNNLNGAHTYTTFTEIPINYPDVATDVATDVGVNNIANNGANNVANNGVNNCICIDIGARIQSSKVGVAKVECFMNHTIILLMDGTLMGAGQNKRGQLGLGNILNSAVFTKIPIPDFPVNEPISGTKHVIQIAGGINHTILLFNDGSIMGAGANNFGQLGIRDDNDHIIFTKIDIIDQNNDYDGLISNSNNYTITENINRITQVACGDSHTMLLMEDGTIMGAGSNSSGQMGREFYLFHNRFIKIINIRNVTQIACGNEHTIILLGDNTIMSCGDNTYGQSGLGVFWGKFKWETFTKAIKPQIDVKKISCGFCFTMVLLNDDSTIGCGMNIYGQLLLKKTEYHMFTGNIIDTGSKTSISSWSTCSCCVM